MFETANSSELERLHFQDFLDETFPNGALCAVVDLARLEGDAVILTTGRLLCSAARESQTGWDHQLLIDPRSEQDESADSLKLWVGQMTRNEDSPHLWEGNLSGETAANGTLRINGDPPPEWRPTPKMRNAVTAAHPEF